MDLTKLNSKISAISLIYLPDLFFQDNPDNIPELINVGYLNTFYFIDKDNKYFSLKDKNKLFEILTKDKVLNNNIFKLLQIKNTLDNEGFNFLIDEYLKELSNWVFLTKTVKDNAKIVAVNYEDIFQSFLEFQHKVLSHHEAEVKQKFVIGKRYNKKHLTGLINNKKILKFEVENDLKETIKTINKNKPILKKEIITAKEADDFLLKQVFGVHIP